MPASPLPERAPCWHMPVLVLLSGWILLFELDAMGLWGIREARVLLPAREMLESGDWLVPRLGGRLRLTKPPLPYWETAALGLVTGRVDLWEARLPGAIQGIGVVLLCYALGRRALGASVGFIGACLLATTFFFVVEFRQASHDPGLTCFSTAAVAAAWWLWQSPSRAAAWLLAVGLYTALGLGFLTKGPAVVAALLPLAAWVFWTRRWRLIVPLKPWLGVVIVPLLAGSWWAALAARGLSPGMALEQDTAAKVSLFQPHSFFEDLPSFCFPWVGLVVAGLVAPFLRRHTEARPRLWFFWLWFASIFVFLSLFSREKLTYLLPAMTPACLLAAYGWQALADRLQRGAAAWEERLLLVVQTALLVLAGAGLAIYGLTQLRAPAWAVLVAGLSLVGAGAAFLMGCRRGPVGGALGAAVLMAIAFSVAYGAIIPSENDDRTYGRLVADLERRVPPEVPLYDYCLQRPFLYYYIRRPLTRVDDAAALKRLCERGEAFHMVVWHGIWQRRFWWTLPSPQRWPGGVSDPRTLFRVVGQFQMPHGRKPELLLVMYDPTAAATQAGPSSALETPQR